MYIRKRKRRRIILFLIMDSLLGPPCKWQLALYFMNPCAMQYCTAQNITCTVVHFAALHWREYHLHCITLCCNALHKTWPALNCTEHEIHHIPALHCMHCFCPCLVLHAILSNCQDHHHLSISQENSQHWSVNNTCHILWWDSGGIQKNILQEKIILFGMSHIK